MDFDEARRVKWEQGRAGYGGTEWVGKTPLEEMGDEYLDAANYAEEAMAQGHISDEECMTFVRSAHALWASVQTILSREDGWCEPEPLAPHRASCGIW